MRYAIFICTHGRPDNQITLNMLRNSGYNGQVYLVLDNEDATGSKYLKYGNHNTSIIGFDKQKWIDRSETGINIDVRSTILYAKNFCEYLAIDVMKLDTFIVADDDISKFVYTGTDFSIKYTLQEWINFCMAFMVMCDVAMMGFFPNIIKDNELIQALNPYMQPLYRLPYNFVFRNSKHRFVWESWIGQDTIANIKYSNRGYYICTIPFAQQEVAQVNEADGGMKDVYENSSLFDRCFHKIMYYPSAYMIANLGDKIAMQVNVDTAIPMLISEEYKK